MGERKRMVCVAAAKCLIFFLNAFVAFENYAVIKSFEFKCVYEKHYAIARVHKQSYFVQFAWNIVLWNYLHFLK